MKVAQNFVADGVEGYKGIVLSKTQMAKLSPESREYLENNGFFEASLGTEVTSFGSSEETDGVDGQSEESPEAIAQNVADRKAKRKNQ